MAAAALRAASRAWRQVSTSAALPSGVRALSCQAFCDSAMAFFIGSAASAPRWVMHLAIFARYSSHAATPTGPRLGAGSACAGMASGAGASTAAACRTGVMTLRMTGAASGSDAGASVLQPKTRNASRIEDRCVMPRLRRRKTLPQRWPGEGSQSNDDLGLEATAHRRVGALGRVECLLAAAGERGLALGGRGGVLPRLLHRLHRLLHRAGGLGLHLA